MTLLLPSGVPATESSQQKSISGPASLQATFARRTPTKYASASPFDPEQLFDRVPILGTPDDRPPDHHVRHVHDPRPGLDPLVDHQDAQPLTPRKIRFNCVSPGFIETPLFREAISASGERGQQLLSKSAGIVEPDLVAQAVVFLLSDASGWINGADLPVDGGTAAAFHCEKLGLT